LPFEGAGVISQWRIELPNDIPQFDFNTIADVVLHMRYTAREAGHLRAPAVEYVTSEVLSDPEELERLFTLPYDFADAWAAFGSAANDDVRTLELALVQDHFPYWVKRLGMDDAIVATFAVVDEAKRKLSLAPAAVAFDGDADDGWTLTIDDQSPVFPFLKKNMGGRVYMTVSYATEG
jgi:hypothetical protein